MSAVRARRRSSVAWFDRWNDELESALVSLPEPSPGSRDIYRILGQERARPDCPFALLTRDGEPSAIVALRRLRPHTWAVRTNWMVPGLVCVSNGEVLPTLDLLRRQVYVAWWRMGACPSGRSVQYRTETPTHRLAVAEREEYWRRGKSWSNLRRARNKCGHLRLDIDVHGDAEWVIRNWSRRWNSDTPPELDDRLTIAEVLERHGRHHTLSLRDGDRRVAGCTLIADGDTLTAGVLYRAEAGGDLPTGNRLIGITFEFAEERGFTTVDLGGKQDYKSSWAPEVGSRAEFTVVPFPHGIARSALAVSRTFRDRATAVARTIRERSPESAVGAEDDPRPDHPTIPPAPRVDK